MTTTCTTVTIVPDVCNITATITDLTGASIPACSGGSTAVISASDFLAWIDANIEAAPDVCNLTAITGTLTAADLLAICNGGTNGSITMQDLIDFFVSEIGTDAAKQAALADAIEDDIILANTDTTGGTAGQVFKADGLGGGSWQADTTTTNLAVANVTQTTLDVTSDDGINATLTEATPSVAGVGGTAGLLGATDKELLDSLDVANLTLVAEPNISPTSDELIVYDVSAGGNVKTNPNDLFPTFHDTGSRIGIGTDGAANKLHVEETTANGIARFRNTAATQALVTIEGTLGTNFRAGTYNNTGTGAFAGFVAQTSTAGGEMAAIFVGNTGGASAAYFHSVPAIGTSPALILGAGSANTIPLEQLDVRGNIIASGTITPSDERYKKNFENIESAVEKLSTLDATYYDWDKKKTKVEVEVEVEDGVDDEGNPKFKKKREKQSFIGDEIEAKRHIGLKAGQVQEVFPELVSEYESMGAEGFKAVNYAGLIPVLVAAIKELKEEIKTLKKC